MKPKKGSFNKSSMAEQRIHPLHDDVEAPPLPQTPTAPLVPQSSSKSDNGDAASSEEQYPPFQRTIPLVHSRPSNKKRSCLCKCFCWTISLLLILIILIAIIIGILYLIFSPKLPKFSIDRMQITQFVLNPDSSLQATFNVTITVRNPNHKIGIYYEGGSHITLFYTDTKLCEGSLPKFYQGHENTTVLNIPLTGQTQNATALARTLQEQQQRTGNVPLDLRVKQPVRIKLGKLKLMKMKFKVKCRLVVDRLSATRSIRFHRTSCKFRFRL